MTLSSEQLSDPIGWSTLLHDASKRYEVEVVATTGDFSNSYSFLKEKMVKFIIKDAATQEQLLSFKTRARGFLKALAEICTRVAAHYDVGVYVASKDGQKRNEMIRRTFRQATPEERAAGKPQFLSERDWLNPQELWEEFKLSLDRVAANGTNHDANIIIAFSETF